MGMTLKALVKRLSPDIGELKHGIVELLKSHGPRPVSLVISPVLLRIVLWIGGQTVRWKHQLRRHVRGTAS